jgi:hypothetical protein
VLAALALPRPLRAPEATPPPVPATPRATPSPPPPPTYDDARLEPLLLGLDKDASREAALRRIQELWGGPPLERTSLRTHLDQLRQLDLPVCLELFHPARRETAFVALLGLFGSEAAVAVGDVPAFRVSTAALDRLWTREAVFLWRDPAGRIKVGQTTPAEAPVREALAGLGYDASGDLASVVSRFQREHDLLPDGLIGGRTLMTLFGAGDLPRPRLKAEGRIS